MAVIEQVEAGTVVFDYLSGSTGCDRVLMAAGEGRTAGASFVGDFSSWDIGGLAGCDVAAEGPSTASGLCGWGADVHIVGALVEGAAKYADGAVARPLPSSSVVVYPGNAPFVFDFDDVFRYVIVKVTPSDLGVTSGALARLAGPRVVETSPFATALAGLLADSADWAGRASPTSTAGLGDEVRRLLRHMVRISDERSFGVDASGQRAAIIEWIEDHLSDPQLDPERIAAAHHISVRQLHRLFADLGVTCRRHLVRRRLDRVRADLVGTDLPLAAIGMRWGIGDPTYLSKAFKREFGASPRELRRGR